MRYRRPFGAVPVGSAVSLSIDVAEAEVSDCELRIWVDGKGESRYAMERRDGGFKCVFTPTTPAIYWYTFILHFPGGGECRYGARAEQRWGEGALYGWEPPSYQLTVYVPRAVPEWYRNGIVYQIFPDRFNRGEDWRALAEAEVSKPRCGPKKHIVEDWGQTPFYDKEPNGRIRSWDFYGGTLSGIEEKLDFLREMGVTVLYINPIFTAASNHRYDTGDYRHVDPMLGGDEAFKSLAKAARERGISIILDGVFNHTGCDSLYFNKYGNFPTLGAYQSVSSPYREWYRFNDSPAGYDSWWGVDDLPALEEHTDSYREFIYGGEDSVVRHWMRAGARGWRLDVADELPDDFIEGIKSAVTETLGDEGLLLGEVWEDASNKVSYGELRRYFQGGELDAVMNYPLADALQGFMLGRISAPEFAERVMTFRENYPRDAFYSSLNLMGSHDRPRIMTVMGEAPDPSKMTEEQRRDYRLDPGKRSLAKSRLWMVDLVQMTMPGVPCIYYGDDAGLEGYADPYNRGTYPWGKEDKDTQVMLRNAIGLRRMFRAFTDGEITPVSFGDDVFGYYRDLDDEHLLVLVNRSLRESHTVRPEARDERCTELVEGEAINVRDGRVEVHLWPLGTKVLHFHKAQRLGAKLRRGAGILCHVTSIPNGDRPGDIGQCARRFVDFLAQSGQRYWQVLPLNPTDIHNSPYAGASAFAANIKLLPESEKELRREFATAGEGPDYRKFVEKNKKWLEPYALFAAIKKKLGGIACPEWPSEYRRYDPALLSDPELAHEAEFQKFCQYRFETEWQSLRRYAHERGVMIIGDLPMFVSDDSSDVWAEPEQFLLTPDGRKTDVAGVPPDYFSEEGQLWNNPLFDWKHLKETGFDWWLRRLERMFDLYDFTRLDHFRGFEAYWAIPAGVSAKYGRWLPCPGYELFKTAYEKFGPLPLLAEDLGEITPAVNALLSRCGFYGTSTMEFARRDPVSSKFSPEPWKISYSSTHDNQTLLGWLAAAHPEVDPLATSRRLRDDLMGCVSDVVIVSLQDALELGDEARMNVPGVEDGQWMWQARTEDFSGAQERLLEQVKKFARS